MPHQPTKVYAAMHGTAVIELYANETDAQWRADLYNRTFKNGARATVVPMTVVKLEKK